jgi:tetratricopeptide (TPR) repeat protein
MKNDSRFAWISSQRAIVAVLAAAFAVGAAGCSGAKSPADLRSPVADKWYHRALADYQAADLDDARDSAQKALAAAPEDKEVRLLAATVALARLDYAEVLRLLKGTPGSEAAGLRGRALWYKGELEGAADELEAMLDDPEVVDPWAKQIAKLAREGAGRVPFALSGGLLAAVEMVQVNPNAPYFVVPVEIDGDPALALVATGTPEVVLDSATRKEASWTSIRFDQRVEVHDIPAQVLDLSGISKQVNAPIRALLGVNLLRHLNATLDYEGHQFVVRTFAPPPPPDSTRLDLAYVKGGGMVVGMSLGAEKDAHAALIVDTSTPFPLSLDAAGWRKAGIDATTLKAVQDDPEGKLKAGTVPLVKLGAVNVTQVPGIFGAPIEAVEKALTIDKNLGFDVDGILGSGLLAHYRITFGDGGRLMWIEDHETIDRALLGAARAPSAPPPVPGLPVLDPLAPSDPLGGALPLGGPANLTEPPPPKPGPHGSTPKATPSPKPSSSKTTKPSGHAPAAAPKGAHVP